MLDNKVVPSGMMEPDEILGLYYKALYSGDLSLVKRLMTPESYIMTLETFGLRLSFRDSEFKAQLKDIGENATALAEVENKLSKELILRKLSPKIEIKSKEWNGTQRQTIEYTEDQKSKKIYFSKEKDRWKINYYAGRKVD